MMKQPWIMALALLPGCTLNPASDDCDLTAAAARRVPLQAPRLDHHQHLLSEAALRVTLDYLRSTRNSYLQQAERETLDNADQLVRMLDEAGIAKALVFSNAYYFARHATEQPGEYDQVRAEQDWTAAEARKHPARLHAACSVNPLRRYALEEIERCAASDGFKALKLHFDASGVDLTNPAHVASVRRAFATANRLGLPIVAHLQSEKGYGAPQARTFLGEILPEASAVPVTVNHLWGGGGYRAGAPEALAVFAEAVQRKDSATGNLWFDLAQVSMTALSNRNRTEIVERMRQIGFARLLYGSDGPQWSGVPPKRHWEEFSACMPVTRGELDVIATNIAPYLR
jgi:predicted TIM-barrel fold metal-dependent hydrolase